MQKLLGTVGCLRRGSPTRFPFCVAVSRRVEELSRPRRFYLEYYNNNRFGKEGRRTGQSLAEMPYSPLTGCGVGKGPGPSSRQRVFRWGWPASQPMSPAGCWALCNRVASCGMLVVEVTRERGFTQCLTQCVLRCCYHHCDCILFTRKR